MPWLYTAAQICNTIVYRQSGWYWSKEAAQTEIEEMACSLTSAEVSRREVDVEVHYLRGSFALRGGTVDHKSNAFIFQVSVAILT